MNIEKLIDAGVTYLNALTDLTKARTTGVLEENAYSAKWRADDANCIAGLGIIDAIVSVPVDAIQEPKVATKKVATKATTILDAAEVVPGASGDGPVDRVAELAAAAAKQSAIDFSAMKEELAQEAKANKVAAATKIRAEVVAASEAKAADPIDYDKQVAPVLQLKALAQRAAVIALLAEFGVKNGKALKPEQYADFLVKINDDTYLDSLI